MSFSNKTITRVLDAVNAGRKPDELYTENDIYEGKPVRDIECYPLSLWNNGVVGVNLGEYKDGKFYYVKVHSTEGGNWPQRITLEPHTGNVIGFVPCKPDEYQHMVSEAPKEIKVKISSVFEDGKPVYDQITGEPEVEIRSISPLDYPNLIHEKSLENRYIGEEGVLDGHTRKVYYNFEIV